MLLRFVATAVEQKVGKKKKNGWSLLLPRKFTTHKGEAKGKKKKKKSNRSRNGWKEYKGKSRFKGTHVFST